MFRRIANKLAGRKKVVDESVGFSAVTIMLSGLNEATKVNVRSDFCAYSAAFRNMAPEDVVEFVGRDFRPISSMNYTRAKHQVFSGKQSERHYIDLQHGSIDTHVGTQEARGTPFRRATLDYTLQAKK